MHVFTFCLLTVLFCKAISIKDDYYWREYKGKIPYDAFPAGRDENGKDTYIGQAYIHGYALAVAQIHPGVKEVSVPCYGVKKTNRNIKILCTRQVNKLTWIPTTAQTLQDDTFGLHPVFGGTDEHEANKGGLYIGSVKFQGILKIGAVTSFRPGNDLLYFPHENNEHSASKYHVLIYNNSAIDTFDSGNDLQSCI